MISKAGSSEAVDAHIYWSTSLQGLYEPDSLMGQQHYHYSPAFAQVIAPATGLPFPVFQTTLLVLQMAVLVWMVGPVLSALALLLPFTNLGAELVLGNVHILIGACVVAGFRWAGVWAFPMLTKVTPGIGLAWFAAREEWRAVGVAMAWTAGISLVSFLLAPSAWREWAAWLVTIPDTPATPNQLLAWAPLPVRFGAAFVVAGVAGRMNARWALPVAVWLALPVIWYNSLPLLLATIPLARSSRRG
ncbi:MAG: glycosyltransferase family 87 protein [Chloroflexota bacterium]